MVYHCLGLILPLALACSPGAPESNDAATSFDRSKPPELAPPKALRLPPIAQRELPNGLRLLIVEHHELPIVDFILLARTGVESDPPGRGGLATLMASLWDEGTTTRSALQIADQQAYLGASVATFASYDATRLELHVPTAQLDSALALFADVALRPSFPAAELDRLRTERLTELIQLRDRGPSVADVAFPSVVFGQDHAYGRPPLGTEASVRAITRDEIEQFYRSHIRPNNSTLIIVGDVRPDDIERRVRAAFGSWEQGTVAPATIGTAPAAPTTAIYLIDKPGAAQSSVRIGGVGVPRSTRDYFALRVMNTILGEAFTSRLNQNLRETKGYTYGAGSRFDMRRSAGPFVARAEIVGEKTDSALIEFMKELRGIHDTVPAAELARAKTYLQLQLPADFEATGDIASQLVPVALYDLPLRFYDSFAEQVEAVTAQDVQRVARQYVDPTRMAIVIVGDRSAIEGGIRKLQLGEISIRDLSGQPIKR